MIDATKSTIWETIEWYETIEGDSLYNQSSQYPYRMDCSLHPRLGSVKYCHFNESCNN